MCAGGTSRADRFRGRRLADARRLPGNCDRLAGRMPSARACLTGTASQMESLARLPQNEARYLNTPRLVADAAGTTVWRWDQTEPFGNNPADQDPDANSVAFDLPLRLPGQRYDKETGLHYNYFRDYDPSVGSYGQPDLVGLVTTPSPL